MAAESTKSDRYNAREAEPRWQAAWDGADENGVTLTQPTHLALDKAGNLYVVQAGIPDVTVLDRHGKFLRRVT